MRSIKKNVWVFCFRITPFDVLNTSMSETAYGSIALTPNICLQYNFMILLDNSIAEMDGHPPKQYVLLIFHRPKTKIGAG